MTQSFLFRLLRAAVPLLVLSFASSAGAYCRTRTETDSQSENPSFTCSNHDATGCCLSGYLTFWRNECVSYDLQKDGSAQAPLATATTVVANAFAHWTGADCGGGRHPSITLEDRGP